jgi:hypothetical protein
MKHGKVEIGADILLRISREASNRSAQTIGHDLLKLSRNEITSLLAISSISTLREDLYLQFDALSLFFAHTSTPLLRAEMVTAHDRIARA